MLRNKKGISPIVGVILVVAMTVLLAAIAWTYMSGMVSNPGKAYIVQPFITKQNPNIIEVRFEGKDVSQIYKVDFSGSTNNSGSGQIDSWILLANGEYYYNNSGTVDTTTNMTKALISNKAPVKVFSFGESSNSVSNGHMKLSFDMQQSFTFITNQATPEANSNRIMITVMFKDGTTQTFEKKL